MLYLAFAFNVLVLAAFVIEMHEARAERKSLALLIKSESVQEFVRAEAQLAAPLKDKDEEEPTVIDFDEASPEDALAAMQGKPPAA